MTNSIALWLGLFLIAGIAADQFWADGAGALFLGRKLFDLVEWLAFWR